MVKKNQGFAILVFKQKNEIGPYKTNFNSQYLLYYKPADLQLFDSFTKTLKCIHLGRGSNIYEVV